MLNLCLCKCSHRCFVLAESLGRIELSRRQRLAIDVAQDFESSVLTASDKNLSTDSNNS